MNFKKVYDKNSELLRDNLWLFIGIFLFGFFGYVYHFFMGRFLGPKDYGVLGTIFSISYLMAVFIEAIQLTVTKTTSEFKVQRKFSKINYLLVASLKKMFVYGCVVCFVLIVLSPVISSFLKINNLYLIVILGLYVLITSLLAVMRGILQGLQKFKALAANYITEGLIKLILGAGLVLLGYGVLGAFGGIVLSSMIAFVFIFFSTNSVKKIEKFDFNSVYSSSFKTLMMLASLTFIYSIDVILVKHFFNDAEAGYYAALSTLGKVILFASYSVNYVMFSKISEYKEANKKTKMILYKSLVLIILINLPILLFYLIFPGFSIQLLFGSAFLDIKNYVGLFGIFMMLFSLVYAISFYNLSLNKKGFIYLLFTFNILEVILISLFHNSIIQIIYILLFLMLALLIMLLTFPEVFKNRTFNSYPGIQ